MSGKAQPKCPGCGIEGKGHFKSEFSDAQNKLGDPWFEIVFCDSCGYVYGIIAKVPHVRIMLPDFSLEKI